MSKRSSLALKVSSLVSTLLCNFTFPVSFYSVNRIPDFQIQRINLCFTMDTSTHRQNSSLSRAAAEPRASSQEPDSTIPVHKSSPKTSDHLHRAHSLSSHLQRGRGDAENQPRPLKISDNIQNHRIDSEIQGTGKIASREWGDERDEHEEALRALESYAAFQLTLLRYLSDDSTENDYPRQTPFPNAFEKTVVESSDLPKASISDPTGRRRGSG